jgi:UDP-N-acetylmuramoyl-L-alanyl-D-glutamate--2,6-diaminopimelate ligase
MRRQVSAIRAAAIIVTVTAVEVRVGARGLRPSEVSRLAIPSGPFLVAGLAAAGRAAVRALSDAVGPDQVYAWDCDTSAGMQRVRRELERSGVHTILGPELTRRQVGQARTVVKSPGIPFSAQVLQRALGKRRTIIDELELGWRLSHAPMLAVTGTNGKSTVCGLAIALLSADGRCVQLAGNTQFGPPLSAIASNDLDWVVCEVSSFQLEGCVDLLPEVAVFTNLTLEHMGRHGTMRRYGEMKRRLFINEGRAVSHAVVDIDSDFGPGLASDIERHGGDVIRVGLSAGADYRVGSVGWNLRRSEISISTPAGRVSLRSGLPGIYNARNLAAALALADLMGVDRERSILTLNAYTGPPGRFEHVDAGQPFDVIVDFAHTPDALEQLLTTVRTGMAPAGRLIVVFGLGGAPGTGMQNMGRVVAERSDRLILTTSGFRGLPRMPALSSTLAGARTPRRAEWEVILNRRRAIEEAVSSAARDDVIVIPGRGALREMRNDGRGMSLPFDDRQVARELIVASRASAGNPA